MTLDDIKVSPARLATLVGIVGGLTAFWLFVTGALDRTYVSRSDFERFWVADSAFKAQTGRMIDRIDARVEDIYCDGAPSGCRERLRRP